MMTDSDDSSRFDEGVTERLRILAVTLDIEIEFLQQCVQCGAVLPEELPEDRAGLAPSQSFRLRRLQRICRVLDIDVFAGCVIVDLLDRMDGMENEMERLRALAEHQPAGL